MPGAERRKPARVGWDKRKGAQVWNYAAGLYAGMAWFEEEKKDGFGWRLHYYDPRLFVASRIGFGLEPTKEQAMDALEQKVRQHARPRSPIERMIDEAAGR